MMEMTLPKNANIYVSQYQLNPPIPQMPSGELVTRKSQMASGFLQDTLSKRSVRISQTPSAKLAAVFPLKKWLIQWAEAAVQNKSGGR